jgi:type II secretory pathway pseudopilin PulG
MMEFLIRKSNVILCVLAVFFIVAYIVFSSLQTSLDFQMNQASKEQVRVAQEREEIIIELAQAQNSDHLKNQSAMLNLIEAPLADGYIDLRIADANTGNNFAKKAK